MMPKRLCATLLFASLAVALAWWQGGVLHRADGQDKKSDKSDEPEQNNAKKAGLKNFMRKKLDASQKVLEGLAVEDFDLISQGAKQLKATSAAADFMVHNDPLYGQHADDFRRIAARLEKAGKEQRLEGAALAYMDMTMSCVECHKFVRNVLIAG
ncbi:MAG: hypothetical protein ACKV0T_01080, partial [Planctomycetales bacterium]